MKIWKAHYTDEHHDLDIEITNTEGDYSTNPLSFCIDGMKFIGSSIYDFELADPTKYEIAKKKFRFLPLLSDTNPEYQLQLYSLDVKIPIQVIRNSDSSLIEGVLQINYEYVNLDCVNRFIPNINKTDLFLDNKIFSPEILGLDFEGILLQIHRLIKDEYTMKCCFMCQWSDYSPYGCDDFGTMQCFKNYKERYLKVNDKKDYFNQVDFSVIDYNKVAYFQETCLCEEFTPRTQCEGYRGYIE